MLCDVLRAIEYPSTPSTQSKPRHKRYLHIHHQWLRISCIGHARTSPRTWISKTCKVIKLNLSRNLRAKNGVENSKPIPSKWYRIEEDEASFV
ncbi:hypothetical protein PIB30_073529 [Stylosanthes scabra]|uniref:Uncharacterized protein n=1 Tax=Stylosanthes scabra TaxID=79078 RepID=A0ABU6SPT1_9FABA|nr:hypothetical protein [Stylosanthes scabra]